MARYFAILLITILPVFQIHAALQVQLSHATFYSPSSGSYVEFYLSFVANDIALKEDNAGFYGEINVTYTVDNGKNDIKTKEFIVQSPLVENATETPHPFISQHRIYLENGEYKINVSIRDIHSDDLPLIADQEVSLNYNNNLLGISDIEIFQSSKASKVESMFYKHGYEIIPYPYDIIPVEMSQIGFYAELYNADKTLGSDSAFLITYYLEDYEDGSMIEGFRGFSKKKADNLNVIMGKFLVTELAEGNYNLRIDVLNKKNELITSKKLAFHKQNPTFIPSDAYEISFVDRYTDSDSLAEHIKYLEPIADRLEWEFAQNQLSENNFDLMKKYFLNFWQQRNSENPEKEWYKYLGQVKITLENFTTPMLPGYLTDRGFRYLKYGPPNDRYESFDEPRAYPYEIWYYNKVNLQSNRMIVFYNKTLTLNDYQILHSDINGELFNKDWNVELHRLNPGVIDNESPIMQDHYGNKSRDWTNMPR